MAPADGTGADSMAPPRFRASSARRNVIDLSPATTLGADDLHTAEPPPSKKPRLKLNVRQRRSNHDDGDTIAVSRPRRETNVRFRYSDETIVMDVEPVKKKARRKQPSPAPSSGLSSLTSAPPSAREESPFQDPTPISAKDDYGDFMSYYIAPGDDEVEKSKAGSSKQKPKTRQKSKPKSAMPKQPNETTSTTAPTPAAPPASKPSVRKQPPAPESQQQSKQHLPHSLPPSRNGAQSLHHVTQAAPPGTLHGHAVLPPPHHLPPGHRPPPIQFPQPIIQFIDVVIGPRPTAPDTVALMIDKLERLSSALTNFGGVPSIPPTPPPEKPKVPEKKKPPVTKSNPLDSFLSHFIEEEDDDDDDESEVNNLDYVPANRGTADGALIYGIQFIQNALRSWAQQRMSHQVTQQWNAQQAEQFQRQMLAQRRGPGRPRRYDEVEPPIQPIIQMNLADTPEGVAIKAFQCVLDSGCLQVNGILPTKLSRALRHLYMQIDHLINQGSKIVGPWQCMSYNAQIFAHRIRVEKWKEEQTKYQEQMARAQQIAQQQVMAQMGLQPHQSTPMTPEQAQHQHALELERRRSMQHAAQQPYISQQHLNPLQLGSQSRGNPFTAAPAPTASSASTNELAAAVGASKTGADAEGLPSQANGLPQGPSRIDKDGAGVFQIDKVKMYTSGLKSRSISDLPKRGPRGATPYQPPVLVDLTNGTSSPSGDAGVPTEIDTDSHTYVPSTGGFTAVNLPVPKSRRPASVSAGSSITVTPRQPGAASASVSPAARRRMAPVKKGKYAVQTKRGTGFLPTDTIVVDQ